MGERWHFILFVNLFLSVIVQVSGMIGATVLSAALPDPIFPTGAGGGLLDLILFAINNVWYFFNLMFIDTSYAMLGVVVFTPLALTTLWLLMELLSGFIPTTGGSG